MHADAGRATRHFSSARPAIHIHATPRMTYAEDDMDLGWRGISHGALSIALPGESWQDFLFVEPDHAFLVRTHLRDVDLVEAGFDVLPYGRDVLLGVRPAGHLRRDHVLGDELARLLEQRRSCQLLRQLAGHHRVAPGLVRDLHGLLLVLVPADLHTRLADALPAVLA